MLEKTPEARFQFGRNWKGYARNIDLSRINRAKESLMELLGKDDLQGSSFLDVGCGSGLFSLAAYDLGAEKLLSIDYDLDSVECASSLHEMRPGAGDRWRIEQGDALDANYMKSLGQFDIVYSWGVLHHTGNLWAALENIKEPVKSGGLLYLSIYNDQGVVSNIWRVIKKLYVVSPGPIKFVMVFFWYLLMLATRVIEGLRGKRPKGRWFEGSERGMLLWYDAVDWVGGYPFEVASFEQLKNYFEECGFSLVNFKKKSGLGCNELVLRREVKE